MKKSKILLVLATLPLVGVISACGGGEKDDPTKTILNVYNYDGGFGTEWLTKAAKRYEAANADKSWEEGKTGVQIKITKIKNGIEYPADILNNKNDVFFIENVVYNEFVANNALYDMTEAITGDNPYEPGKTIESKLSEQQIAAFRKDGKYYGVPHYGATYGLSYNIGVFDDKNLYFAKDWTDPEDAFVYSNDEDRSCGPDGVFGTYDDGLPSTYEEFFLLLEQMSESDVVPIIWTGEFIKQYTTIFLHNLSMNADGATNAARRISFDGEHDNLVKYTNGTFDFTALESVVLDGKNNGYEAFRSAGTYNALKFFEKLISTGKYYANDTDGKGTKCFNGSYSNISAQDDFILGAHVNGNDKQVGLLVEGMWWENEASQTFKDGGLNMKTAKYGWLPLPKPTAAQLDEGNVYVDVMNSFGLIKKNIAAEKAPVAIDFIQFVNTDESLKEFSYTTNTFKNLDYSMSESELAQLSVYGRSLMQFKQNSHVVMTGAQTTFFLNNERMFCGAKSQELYGINASSYPAYEMYHNKTTAENYFKAMYAYYKDTVWGRGGVN